MWFLVTCFLRKCSATTDTASRKSKSTANRYAKSAFDYCATANAFFYAC
jgi:hypothetical protein